MKRWTDLYAEIDAARQQRRHEAVETTMIVAVQRAVKLGICSRQAPFWIKRKDREVGLPAPYGDANIRGHQAIALSGLAKLEDARLTFRIVLDRHDGIVQYTVGAEGTERGSGRGWYARIDLDPEQRGQGPCGHPLLHCHVGVDAADKGHDTRVPLPWLFPDEALAWILATLHDQLEPT